MVSPNLAPWPSPKLVGLFAWLRKAALAHLKNPYRPLPDAPQREEKAAHLH